MLLQSLESETAGSFFRVRSRMMLWVGTDRELLAMDRVDSVRYR